MCNGPNNYALVQGCGCDKEGQPAYGPLFPSIILHEFAHNFTNPLSEQYWPQMEEAGNRIFPHVAQQMTQSAYGDARTMTGEWLNELCVLMAYREPEA